MTERAFEVPVSSPVALEFEEVTALPPQSPGQIFWRHFRRSQLAVAGGALLVIFYGLALCAPFFAPYSPEEMDRGRFYHPPQALRWFDASGHFHALPFVYPTVVDPSGDLSYREDRTRTVPVRFFTAGAPYHLFGLIPSRLHLYGVRPPDRIFLLGADGFGRDELSRLLFGSQVSLTVGLVGIAISFVIGLLLGGISGYFGGWVDTVIMR